nr:GNAT family N-acetyltransferase [uncultured Enterobacter sp.]
MLTFRKMYVSEFAQYLDYFIPDYAAEIKANYRLSEDLALQQARTEIASSLPDGVNTQGHVLLCIQSERDGELTTVGYLWYKPAPLLKSAWINDFVIFPRFQNRGYGRKALALLESTLEDEGYQQIKLRVAGENQAAQHLYTSCGFDVTGINMNKVLMSTT